MFRTSTVSFRIGAKILMACFENLVPSLGTKIYEGARGKSIRILELGLDLELDQKSNSSLEFEPEFRRRSNLNNYETNFCSNYSFVI